MFNGGVMWILDIPLWRFCGVSQGKGEFSMEYAQHAAVTRDVQAELSATFLKTRGAGAH